MCSSVPKPISLGAVPDCDIVTVRARVGGLAAWRNFAPQKYVSNMTWRYNRLCVRAAGKLALYRNCNFCSVPRINCMLWASGRLASTTWRHEQHFTDNSCTIQKRNKRDQIGGHGGHTSAFAFAAAINCVNNTHTHTVAFRQTNTQHSAAAECRSRKRGSRHVFVFGKINSHFIFPAGRGDRKTWAICVRHVQRIITYERLRGFITRSLHALSADSESVYVCAKQAPAQNYLIELCTIHLFYLGRGAQPEIMRSRAINTSIL